MWQTLSHIWKVAEFLPHFLVLVQNQLIPTADTATFQKWEKVCHFLNVAVQLFLAHTFFYCYPASQ